MAISFDAASNSGDESGTNPAVFSHTVGSISNGILIVTTHARDTSSTDIAVSSVVSDVDGAFTKAREDIHETASGSGTWIQSGVWYLLNPTAGSHTITVTSAGTISRWACGAISYAGIKQSGVVGDHDTAFKESGGDDFQSVTLTTTATGSLILSAAYGGDGGGFTVDASMTERVELVVGGDAQSACTTEASTITDYTETYTQGSSDWVIITAVEFLAYVADVTITPAALALSLSVQSVTKQNTLAPSAQSLSLTSQSPTNKVTVLPSAQSLTASAQTVTPKNDISVSAQGLTLSAQTPTPEARVFPNAQSLSITAETPLPSISILASALSLALTVQTPDPIVIVLPNAQTLTITAESVTVSTSGGDVTISVAALSLLLSVPAPTLNISGREYRIFSRDQQSRLHSLLNVPKRNTAHSQPKSSTRIGADKNFTRNDIL